MELDLDRQEPGRSALAVSGDLDLGLGDGHVGKAAVAGDLVVQNLESRCLVNGTVAARGTTGCGRCLRDFELSWPAPVDIMVLRDVDSDEEEGETLLIQQRNGVVDLRDAVRECVVLAHPQSPVCREDCRGLCSSCGCDLNETSCACAKDDYDPRWEGLPE